MDVQSATLEDIDAVARILSVIRKTTITADAIRAIYTQTIESPYSEVLLVRNDGAPVGMGVLNCVLKLNRIECRLDELVVLPEARGKGAGKALAEACNQWAWDKGCYKIEFTSRSERTGSIAFYEKLGYQKRDSNIYTKFSPDSDYVKTKVI